MDRSAPETTAPLQVRPQTWPVPLHHPRMSNREDVRPGLHLTNRYLVRADRPWIPVMGEMHYSRVPAARWSARLRQMRAGGVTVVATYLPWIHHVEHRGKPRFDGNLDLGAFIDQCTRTGLDVVLRIGPWVHGEIRNGGFPDWVQAAPVRHRTDDPGYLDLVREWFGQLGTALAGRCRTGTTILAVQLENELYDQPGHLITLKRLAREAGISAPIWTATGWGSAQLPTAEVLPLYGGYADGFWVDAGLPWDPSFRAHFFFSHVWDDPGIGADLRPAAAAPNAEVAAPNADVAALSSGVAVLTAGDAALPAGNAALPAGNAAAGPSSDFPTATCELGGGMATAYHRRPRPEPLDIATVAHCKIGNGSAWQGYYMYVGGTNPPGDHGLQESHATGYPNDLPRLNYDFHAPIGTAGTLSGTHAPLRRQHAFLIAFGPQLATLPSTLPEVRPRGVEDTSTLRWAVRSIDGAGFLFIAWHQPQVPLDTYRGAQFALTVQDESVLLPSGPVDIPPGTLARWPLNLTVGGIRLRWATASVVSVLPGEIPTLVLTAESGIAVELALDPDTAANGRPLARTAGGSEILPVVPGPTPVRLESLAGALDVLVLSSAEADRVWVQERDDPAGRRLLLGTEELAWGTGPEVDLFSSSQTPDAVEYDPQLRSFRPLRLNRTAAPPTGISTVPHTLLRPAAAAVPARYGSFGARPSAPTPAAFDQLSARYELDLPVWACDPEQDAVLHLRWAGDVAELRVDGRLVDDRFWDGSTWTVNLIDLGVRANSLVTLHLLPLSSRSDVHLPAEAAVRLAASDRQLLALDDLTIEGRCRWAEQPAVPTPAEVALG